MIKGCIFDLDGVIVDTAKFHFKSWQDIAVQLGGQLSLEQNEKLKGVSRMGSLDFILKLNNISIPQEKKIKLAAQKNECYLKLIEDIDQSEMLPGILDFIKQLKKENYKIGLGSASRNAITILQKLKIDHYFEAQIDGNMVTKSKPDPEVFLKGAKGLDIYPSECIVFEDSIKGITAANQAGFISVGVGDKNTLTEATYVIEGFTNLNPNDLFKILSRN